MANIRAMRLLGAIELGATDGAELESLLADPSRQAEWSALLEMRGQTRRMAASNTAINAIVASPTAINAVASSGMARSEISLNDTAFNAVTASSTAFGKFIAGCADLVPAHYADIAAVIASSDAMSAVAESPEAMAAIAASTTAMNAVAASSAAMGILAASRAAMTAIAASSTAMTAIAASSTAMTAIELTSPYSASVPTMTSNTSPVGVVSANRQDGGEAWRAFDKSTVTWWQPNGAPENWINYRFPYRVSVYKVTINNDGTYGMNAFKIQASNNGVEWTDVATSSMALGEIKTLTPSLFTRAYYWRLLGTTQHNQTAAMIKELNFYGIKV